MKPCGRDNIALDFRPLWPASHSINPKSPDNCFQERFAIIEADNTWNETFLDLYNRGLGRAQNLE